MHCASCNQTLEDEAFTGDVCPHCRRFVHPTRLGVFEDLELIERGGMSAVYRARHPELGTKVAIKVVAVHLAPEGIAERFEREAKIAAKIDHPGAVHVFDIDHQEGRLYLVMEFVEGETLRQLIRRGERDTSVVIELVRQLCEVLHAAHEHGVIHRDIKPENVMVDSRGSVRVLDFGISRLTDDGERLTRTGEILGTPEYMAPEQILDEPGAIDSRTDVHSVGVVLYELLTGKSPFHGANIFQVLKLVESLDPPAPSTVVPSIPPSLDDLVTTALAKEKSQRPVSCLDFADRLASLGGRRMVKMVDQPGGPRLGVAVLIVLVFIAGFGVREFVGDAIPEPVTALPQPRTPTAEIQDLLAGLPRDRRRLAEVTRRIPDDASQDDIRWRGIAHKELGNFLSALMDLQRAGFPEPQHSIVWSYVHRLLPLVMEGPRWIVGSDASVESHVAALADGDVDKLVIAGVDAALAGNRSLARQHAERARALDADHPALELLSLVFLDAEARTAVIEGLQERTDRLEPMRYFFEVVQACRNLDGRRLPAASELLLLAGDAEHTTSICLATRLWVGGSARWDVWAHSAGDIDDMPGARISQFLVARAAGDQALADERIKLLPDVMPFAAWRDCTFEDRAFYDGWAQWNFGGSDRTAMEAWLANANVSDAAGWSRLCIAVSIIGRGRALGIRTDLDTEVDRGIVQMLENGTTPAFFDHGRGLRVGDDYAAWMSARLVAGARLARSAKESAETLAALLERAARFGADVDGLLAEKGWETIAAIYERRGGHRER